MQAAWLSFVSFNYFLVLHINAAYKNFMHYSLGTPFICWYFLGLGKCRVFCWRFRRRRRLLSWFFQFFIWELYFVSTFLLYHQPLDIFTEFYTVSLHSNLKTRIISKLQSATVRSFFGDVRQNLSTKKCDTLHLMYELLSYRNFQNHERSRTKF